MVMLGDAVNAKKGAGEAKDTLEVIDVAQLLARSVRLQSEAADTTVETGKPGDPPAAPLHSKQL